MEARLIVRGEIVASVSTPDGVWPKEIQSPITFAKPDGEVKVFDDAGKHMMTVYPDAHVCKLDSIVIGNLAEARFSIT